MSMPRKRYRQYLEPGSNREIPKSTYYRWRSQGLLAEFSAQAGSSGFTLHPKGAHLGGATGTPTIPTSSPVGLRTSQASEDHQHSVEIQEDSSRTYGDGIVGRNNESQDVAPLDSPDRSPNSAAVDLGSELFWSFTDRHTDDTGNVSDEDNVNIELMLGEDNAHTFPASSELAPEKLNEPVRPGHEVTKFEAILMVFHIAMRHGMAGVFLEDMMKVVNKLIGDVSSVPASKYLFQKLFNADGKMEIHFFCPQCQIYLGASSLFPDGVVLCTKCGQANSVTSHNDGNFFVSLSVRDQLQDLLQRPDLKIILQEPRRNGVISDIFDGIIYKSLMKHCEGSSSKNPLTITFNTDGAPVFKSSKNSLWPIHFLLNEIHPEQRFLPENVLLGGLWFGSEAALMSVFLTPFVAELCELSKSGIVWKTESNGVIESPVFVICCCTDSVAKPKVQNVMQFNGGYGCGYCLHPNTPVMIDEGTGKTALRYTPEHYEYRTDRSMRKDMKVAKKRGRVFGVKGMSPLCPLPGFNIVCSFGIDYMHAVLEGVIKKLAGLWFDTCNHQRDFYLGTSVGLVDRRLATITPPSSVGRGPRPMSDRVHYKANEWRSFLLYYSLPCLLNILPSNFFHHFRKFVTAVYILLKESMSHEEVQYANDILQDFVSDFAKLYGNDNMVYNVHLCTHLGKSVSMLGPLWAYSAFVFESSNGHLLKLVKGTTGVATQICRKYLMSRAVVKLVHGQRYKVSEDMLDLCGDIINYRHLKNAEKFDNILLLGRGSLHKLSVDERQLLLGAGCGAYETVHYFNRAVVRGVIYHGKRYSKQEQFDDSCVRLKNDSFAVIDVIFKLEGQNDVRCFLRVLNIAEDGGQHMAPHIQLCSLQPYGTTEVMSLNFVARKAILMSCNGKKYVSEAPNRYEKD